MRVLFTFIGGLGHFYPLEPIARAVAADGHQVAVACSAGLVDRVEALGLVAFATSPARPPEAGPPTRDLTPLEPVDHEASELEFAENFARKGARRHATAVQEHVRAWQPDLVVRDEADLGSAVAAEVLGVPTATVLVLAAGMLVRPELVGPPLADLRAEHGLPADPGLTVLSRGLVLSPFPPSFRDPASPVPLPETTLHFRSGAPRLRVGPPRARRRVYVTLGTVFNTGSGDLMERLLAGLGGLDADVIMTVGPDLDPADLGPQPPHVRVERFVPQGEVLPEADLVVSHGGSGSLVATLAHGLPSVLLPLGADQPHNASRAEELGLALTLDAATVSPESIRRAAETALYDEPMRRRARAVAQEIDALPGVEAVLPLLEALSRSGR